MAPRRRLNSIPTHFFFLPGSIWSEFPVVARLQSLPAMWVTSVTSFSNSRISMFKIAFSPQGPTARHLPCTRRACRFAYHSAQPLLKQLRPQIDMKMLFLDLKANVRGCPFLS